MSNPTPHNIYRSATPVSASTSWRYTLRRLVFGIHHGRKHDDDPSSLSSSSSSSDSSKSSGGPLPRISEHGDGGGTSSWSFNFKAPPILLVYGLILTCVFGTASLYTRRRVRFLQQELRRLEAVSEVVTKSKQVGLEKANFVSSQLKLAQTATHNIEHQIEEQRNNRPAIHLTPDYIRLTQQIQSMNHYELIDRFGEGPYHVQIDLEFPWDDGLHQGYEDTSVPFVIELAENNVMPHSVLHFLKMVHSGLWDGCSFSVSTHHFIQAWPVGYRHDLEQQGEELQLAFARQGLTALSFQEYSPKWEHDTFTVGFDGLGEGPSFFINTADNRVRHGPPQPHELGDPCFGRIISGFSAIHRIYNLPIDEHHNLIHNVGIHKATILGHSDQDHEIHYEDYYEEHHEEHDEHHEEHNEDHDHDENHEEHNEDHDHDEERPQPL
eukprot:CAMPEP_0198284718 /NCGR_PEP_ID=MMETSP1449-20131203/4172_1 /TAXON_ID=420275 /ORGANISM="Attheya septentrionalis, Strain CCMP2084" /LENGTH=436 /DNA_ID=CAMNT_0043981927 /DNA_START=264 /DNA_END=1574 /DNA_ORIENTATION=-